MGRSRFAAALIALASLLGAAGIAAWAAKAPVSVTEVAGAACLWLACVGCAVRGLCHSPAGVLAWSGDDWTWTAEPGAQAGAPQVVLDLQHVLLLCWRGEHSRRRWLWAERRAQPASWQDMRRAVYSRALPGGARPAGGPSRT